MIHSRTKTLLWSTYFLAAVAVMGCAVDPESTGDQNKQEILGWKGTELQITAPKGDSLMGRIAISPDGSLLVAPAYTIGTGTVREDHHYLAVFDLKDGKLIRKIPARVSPLEINKSGELLLAQGASEYSIYNITTGELVVAFGSDVRIASFMHDGERVLVQTLRGNEFITTSLDIYSARTGQLLKSVPAPERQVWLLTITPDDRYVMLREDFCSEGNLYLWDLENGGRSGLYSIFTEASRDAAARDGLTVSMQNATNNTTEFRESMTGMILSTVPRAEFDPRPVEISNDGIHFAQILRQNNETFDINLKKISDGALVKKVVTVQDRPIDVRFSADGKILAVGLPYAGILLYKFD